MCFFGKIEKQLKNLFSNTNTCSWRGSDDDSHGINPFSHSLGFCSRNWKMFWWKMPCDCCVAENVPSLLCVKFLVLNNNGKFMPCVDWFSNLDVYLLGMLGLVNWLLEFNLKWMRIDELGSRLDADLSNMNGCYWTFKHFFVFFEWTCNVIHACDALLVYFRYSKS